MDLGDERTLKVGRLEMMKTRERLLRNSIDALCKNIIDLFTPMTVSMDYTYKINLDRFEAHAKDLKTKVKEIGKLRAEMEALELELGVENGL
jgi:hypothetical protein